MPDKRIIEKARRDKREGKSASTQAGEFVREEIDKIRRGESVSKNLGLVEDLCNTMKFGSLCALGGFTPYPVLSALKHFREDFGPVPGSFKAAE